MKWRLVFGPNGIGEHWAVAQEGGRPTNHPFRWHLEGKQVHLDYVEEQKFRQCTLDFISAAELRYPMPPLGTWFVLRPDKVTAPP